ncbi:hypothetical protein VKT23_019428 [Stygiomarasmius scandens]|uniref:F-box domain-containing protein n=1 Tax=Marasmiellus scandens TaxID=2682957 RepID=A0ABR1ILP1_9AGAR
MLDLIHSDNLPVHVRLGTFLMLNPTTIPLPRHFPDFLLVEILQLCDGIDLGAPYPLPAALAVSSINKRWRSLALFTHKLWAKIIINHSNEWTFGQQKVLSLVLSRSASYPLHIILRGNPGGCTFGSLVDLIPHCRRWKIFHLDFDKDDVDLLGNILQMVPSLPMLCKLVTRETTSLMKLPLRDAAKLRSLSLVIGLHPVRLLKRISWSELTELVLEGESVSETGQFLSGLFQVAQKLRHITLGVRLWTECLPPPPITLPCATSLTINRKDKFFSEIVKAASKSLRLPSVTQLNLSFGKLCNADVQVLLGFLSTSVFPYRLFSLGFAGDISGNDLAKVLFRTRNIRSLSLSLRQPVGAFSSLFHDMNPRVKSEYRLAPNLAFFRGSFSYCPLVRDDDFCALFALVMSKQNTPMTRQITSLRAEVIIDFTDPDVGTHIQAEDGIFGEKELEGFVDLFLNVPSFQMVLHNWSELGSRHFLAYNKQERLLIPVPF